MMDELIEQVCLIEGLKEPLRRMMGLMHLDRA